MSRANLGDLETEILAYWEKHPSAKDTAEGITRFWLSTGGQSATLGEVQEVLRTLVKKNTLTVVEAGRGSATVYKLRVQPQRT